LVAFGSIRRFSNGQSIGIGLHLVALGSRCRLLNGPSVGIGLHLVLDVVF